MASKRASRVATTKCRWLRKTIETPTTSSSSAKKQQRARLTTVAESATSKVAQRQQRQPLVMSRRAWLRFKESRGVAKKKPDPSKRKIPGEEKPWPRNMQIAGYVGGAIAVPYIILWTITSNPTLREWFGPIVPLDKLRTYYGKLEADAHSYTEEMDYAKKEKDGSADPQSMVPYHQFPEEAPYHVRKQQQIIAALNESDVAVTISLSSSSSPSLVAEEIVTETISAKTIASAESLLAYFPSALSRNDGSAAVAVDFLDANQAESSGESETTAMGLSSDGALMTDADSIGLDGNQASYGGATGLSSGSRKVAKDTQSMSKWEYVHDPTGRGSQKGSEDSSPAAEASRWTDTELKMEKLEYQISELEKNLRDPACTRNIDDMTTELSQAKREHSRLKWRKRFGFSR